MRPGTQIDKDTAFWRMAERAERRRYLMFEISLGLGAVWFLFLS